MAWTSSDLLDDIRRSGMFPSQASTGTADADLLLQADKELQTRLYPLLMTAREEHYVRSSDYETADGQTRFRLSKRSFGQRVRDVLWLAAGDVDNAPVISLPRIAPEELWRFSSNNQRGEPLGFFMEGAHVVPVPSPQQGNGLVRVKWFARPGRLAAANTTTARSITDIETSPGLGSDYWRVTLSGAHVFTAAVDFIKGSTPFEHVATDVDVVPVAGTTFDVLKADLPDDFDADNNVGDWVCSPDTSPVMQLPVELHGVLAQRVVVRLLLSLGYDDEARLAEKDAQMMEREALQVLVPRIEGEPRKVVGGPMWRRRSGVSSWRP